MTPEVGWIWLAERLGAGSALGPRLLEAFGSPEEIWRAPRDSLAAAVSMTKRRLEYLADKDLSYAQRIWEDCVRKNITVLALTDAAYPPLLGEIASPPVLL